MARPLPPKGEQVSSTARPDRMPARGSTARRGRDRSAAPPTPVRPRHRPPAWPAALDRRRSAAPARPRPPPAREPAAPVIRYERDRARRADPHRHQEARPHRRDRPPHHRRPAPVRATTAAAKGWDVSLHVAIDDASRLAYTEVLPDEKKESADAFLERASAGSPGTACRSSAS